MTQTDDTDTDTADGEPEEQEQELYVAAIGGPPAVGKSTVVKRVLREYDAFHRFEWGGLAGRVYADVPLAVLGLYDDGADFDGTDRLPMDVIEDASSFIYDAAEDPATPFTHVLFEGDRLYNDRFLDHCAHNADETLYLVLDAPEDELTRRHEARGDTQSETWLKGRRTKYETLATREDVTVMPHTDAADMEAVADELLTFLPPPD